MAKEAYNLFNAMMEFEGGEISDDEVVKMFVVLGNNGMLYSLQGFYGRTFRALTDAGLIVRSKNGKFRKAFAREMK